MEIIEPEPEEEEEEVEEPVVEVLTEPVEGWDGWKLLLLRDLDLGDDFKLPDPITTEGYVPTPPKASLNNISIKGKTVV